MAATPSPAETPLVSVVLTTRDRPHFLPIILGCYRRQTYPRLELIVVDDGPEFPVDEAPIRAAGGRLVRMEPGTMLGTKLNRGVMESRGKLCQKMDDDDWYAPDFIATMVSALTGSWDVVCRPTIAFLMHFLFFDVARWELRESIGNNVPGATLLFSRDAWDDAPFRPVGNDEDNLFLRDQLDVGSALLPVHSLESFLAVRHGGGGGNRGHTWTSQSTGQVVEDYMQGRPLYGDGPQAVLPPETLQFYRAIQRDLLARSSTNDPVAAER